MLLVSAAPVPKTFWGMLLLSHAHMQFRTVDGIQ